MAKFLLVGDCHGDFAFANAVTKFAKDRGVETVFQLGDFGIWDHKSDGEYFLDTLNENSTQRGVHWYFVAGNHENYDRLEKYAAECTYDDGMVFIRDSITWVGRANVWRHDGLTFGAIGGAVSIDREWRTEGDSWWPQEFTNLNDLMLLDAKLRESGRGSVDVMLSHDAPDSLPTFPGFIKDDFLSNANRSLINQAWEVAHPTQWFHGHYHQELVYDHKGTTCYGLDCNPMWASGGSNILIYNNGDIRVARIGE